MTEETLYKEVLDWRLKMERAWCRGTAYPKTEVQTLQDYPSAGQCAVSSLFLIQHMLLLQKSGMRMMQGHVFAYPNQKTAIPSHVWLQREKDGKALILDVTPDQSEFYKGPIGFSSDTENKYGLSYRSEKELTLEKAKTQELWNRYKLLCSLMKIGGQENKV